MNLKLLMVGATTAVALAGMAGAASANATFTDATGQYTVGIGPNGELYDNTTGIGLRNPAGADYISPGTPRDSWGIKSQNGSAYADYAYYGTSNISGSITTLGTNSATVVSTTGLGLTVSQFYTFFSPNIVSIQETVTNTTGSTQNVVFRRNVDLDVYPTQFNENTVGPLGADSQVIAASYYGFENPDPSSPYNSSCTVSCNYTGDLGAGIDLDLGAIAAGDSTTFAYFYGINQPGQSLTGLFNEAQTEGLAYLIGSQSSENGQYPNLGAGSAFLGVSPVGVVAHPPGPSAAPEPGTWALMLLGIGGLGLALRANRRADRKLDALSADLV